MEMDTRVQILDEAAWGSLRIFVRRKAEIYASSLRLWVNSMADLFLLPWLGFQSSRTEHFEFKPAVLSLKLTLCHIMTVAVGI